MKVIAGKEQYTLLVLILSLLEHLTQKGEKDWKRERKAGNFPVPKISPRKSNPSYLKSLDFHNSSVAWLMPLLCLVHPDVLLDDDQLFTAVKDLVLHCREEKMGEENHSLVTLPYLFCINPNLTIFFSDLNIMNNLSLLLFHHQPNPGNN